MSVTLTVSTRVLIRIQFTSGPDPLMDMGWITNWVGGWWGGEGALIMEANQHVQSLHPNMHNHVNSKH